MMKVYSIEGDKFSPSLSSEMIDSIICNLKKYSEEFETSESYGMQIIDLLANPLSEGEYILSYEFLYNIYLENVNISEISTYISENQLPITYESLETFFLNENQDASPYKVFSILVGLKTFSVEYNEPTKEIELPNTINKETKIEDIINIFNDISSIEYKKNTFGNLIDYLNNKNHFSDGLSIEDTNYLRLNTNYNQYTDLELINKVRNERHAYSKYKSLLASAISSQKLEFNKDFKIDIIKETWDAISKYGDRSTEESLEYRNDRKLLNASILYLPSSKNNRIISDPEKNDLLINALNSSYFYENIFRPALGRLKCDELLIWLIKENIIEIDTYNRSLETELQTVISVMRTTLGEIGQEIKIGLEFALGSILGAGALFIPVAAFLGSGIVGVMASSVISASLGTLSSLTIKDAIENVPDISINDLNNLFISAIKEAINTVVNKKVYYYKIGLGIQRDFKLYSRYKKLYDFYFGNNTGTSDKDLNNILEDHPSDEWDKIQFLYGLKEFFKFDAFEDHSNDIVSSIATELNYLKNNYEKLKNYIKEESNGVFEDRK